MGARTEISWTDSSFNPWRICTPTGPGCDNCYAAALSRRFGWGEYAQGVPRQRASEATWRMPLAWNRLPFFECRDCQHRFAFQRKWKEGIVHCPACKSEAIKDARRRVFCASLADVFDNEVDPVWRRDLFNLIDSTANLDWLLLTKRIGNVMPMLKQCGYGYHEGPFGDRLAPLPRHLWLGATVVNQEEADRDVPKLLAVPAAVRFLSIEPMLSPISIPGFNSSTAWCPRCRLIVADSLMRPHERIHGINVDQPFDGDQHCAAAYDMLHWVIAGGESGPAARPMHPDWARSLRDQCAAAGVPFLFKQWGEWAPGENCGDSPTRTERVAYWHFDGPWHFSALTPRESEETHRDDAPDLYRVGKKAAGDTLDGKVHQAFPS